MAKESDLRQRLAEFFRERRCFVQSIESETNPGMPDMYWSYMRGRRGWLELKHIKEMPKRASTSVFRSMNHPLRKEQIIWIAEELKHGGNVNIIVGYGREYFLVPGEQAAMFNDFTEERLREFICPKQQLLLRILNTFL